MIRVWLLPYEYIYISSLWKREFFLVATLIRFLILVALFGHIFFGFSSSGFEVDIWSKNYTNANSQKPDRPHYIH